MIVRILVEAVLAVGIFVVSNGIWEIRRRRLFLGHALKKQAALEAYITRERLAAAPKDVSVYAEKTKLGYAANVIMVIEADARSQKQAAFISMAIVLIALVFSWFLGIWYFLASLPFVVLPAWGSISQAAQQSVLSQILSLALILYKWRLESPTECDQWVSGRQDLAFVYDAVKRISE